MRIHTDADVSTVRRVTAGLPVFWHTFEEHGSRTHAHALEIRLEGSGGRNNTGMYGAGDYNGATWDEWGAVLARVFALDSTARMGGTAARPIYADADDFHFQTGDRFRGGELPENTHPRHRWVHEGINATGAYGVSRCGKCGALNRTIYKRELVTA